MNYTQFLDSFFEQINKVGLKITGLPLDHIAYQASTKEDYEQHLPKFSHLKLNFENGLTLKFLQRPILELFEEKKSE